MNWCVYVWSGVGGKERPFSLSRGGGYEGSWSAS